MSQYSASGVNIDAGNQAVELMKSAIRATHGPEVLASVGSFGGLFDANALKQMAAPILVASTDGVGTKVKLATATGRLRDIGHDLVNHCLNDILVQAGQPLFFMDYYATSQLNPINAAEVVTGLAEACQIAGCALLGGETAEMPGVYAPGEFDLVGTVVGVVDRAHLLPRPTIQPGDVLLGFASSGPHTNGYSLIRRIVANRPLTTPRADLNGQTLADVLLTPHRSYLGLLKPLLTQPNQPIKALAHITGGGIIDNLPRILPEQCAAEIQLGTWPMPPIFEWLVQRGDLSTDEAYRVFNMGLGMLAVVSAEDVAGLQSALPEATWVVGSITRATANQPRVTLPHD